jgi:hypothetical protein
MGTVWSITTPPLGPAGQPATWSGVAAADTAEQADFGAAASYPDSPWKPVNRDDTAESAKASELESEAATVLEEAITKGQIKSFTDPGDAIATSDDDRFLEQGGKLYGAVHFEDIDGTKSAVVVASYDPGNPLGTARQITAGIFLLFVLHLLLLNRVEKRVKTTVTEPA